MGGMPKSPSAPPAARPSRGVSPQEKIAFVPLPSWIQAAARCGFAIDPILREIGVRVDGIRLNEVSVSLAQSSRLIESCVARSEAARARGEHFPFVFGESFAFGSIPEIETYLATCTTLRKALRALDWVSELMSQSLRMTLHESSRYAQLRIDLGDYQAWPAPTRYFTEAWLASMLRFTRTLIGRNAVERVLVRHAAPDYGELYARHFAAEVRFEQPYNAIVLPRELLDQPLFGALPELHRQAEVSIEQRVSRLTSQVGISGQLERLFGERPALLSLGIEGSAEQLGMQVRTLQRRLQSEGESFAALQARLRFRQASKLLRETELDLDSISERLGFSERRAFTRAFSRWAGMSPSAFRRSPKG